MLKDSEWVDWDGSDVRRLLITEEMTLAQIKKYWPNKYVELIQKKVKK